MSQFDQIRQLLEALIFEGEQLVALARTSETNPSYRFIDEHGGNDWSNRLRLFKSMAGPLVQPWSDRLGHPGGVTDVSAVWFALSALTTVRTALDQGLLFTYRDLVVADTFADLLEQADYLASQGFLVAAAVLFRAVLEEHLRNLCSKYGCVPQHPKPTINHFNQELHKKGVAGYTPATFHHVQGLAAIGNEAAHRQKVTKDECDHLGREVRSLLARIT